MKIRNDPLIPPAVEWWEKELEKYLNTDDHLYDCCGYSEGLECCLDKKWIRRFIKKIIRKTKEVNLKGAILEDKNEGGYLFRDDGGYGTEMIKKYKEMMRKEKK